MDLTKAQKQQKRAIKLAKIAAALFVGIIVLVIFTGTDNRNTATSAPTLAVDPMKTASEIIKSIPSKPEWDRIDISEAEPNDYSFTLIYKSDPIGGRVGAETDMRMIARAILARLMNDGIDPKAAHSQVFVSAQQEGFVGETGTPLVLPFGTVTYNYNTDLLEYYAP